MAKCRKAFTAKTFFVARNYFMIYTLCDIDTAMPPLSET